MYISAMSLLKHERPFITVDDEDLGELLNVSSQMIEFNNQLENDDPDLFRLTKTVHKSLIMMYKDLHLEIANRN